MKLADLARIFAPKRVLYVPSADGTAEWDRALAANLTAAGCRCVIETAHFATVGSDAFAGTKSLASIAPGVDLAVVSLPQSDGNKLIATLAALRCQGVVLIGAAASRGLAWDAEREGLRRAAHANGLRVFGPDRIGIIVPGIGLNAGASPMFPRRGPLALLTQSDSLAATMLDWAEANGIGFSKVVSVGETADVEFGDLLDYLATDTDTRAILLHLQRVADARRFMSAARAAARAKPVLVVRGGHGIEGLHAGRTIARRLIRTADAYHAAFKRAGMVRANTLEGLFAAAETLPAAGGRSARSLKRGRLAIVANGTAPALLAADTLAAGGARLAPLPLALGEACSNCRFPVEGAIVDLGAEADADAYARAIGAVAASPEVDAILAICAPTRRSDSAAVAKEIAISAARIASSHQVLVLTAWLERGSHAAAMALFAEHHVPAYETPELAVRAFLVRVRYERAQSMLLEIPATVNRRRDPDRARARETIGQALAAGLAALEGADALGVLEAYGVPCVRMRSARSRREAIDEARSIGFPVSVTIIRHDQTSDDLPTEVRAHAEAGLRQQLARLKPGRGARYLVHAASSPVGALDLYVGFAEDADFGPVIAFGQGGAEASAVGDSAFALPPLNAALARQLMAETRIGRLILEGGPNVRVSADAVIAALCDVSRLIAEQPALVEADINPLWANEQGVVAAGARFRIAPPPAGRPADHRLAVKAYPAEFESTLDLWDGRKVLLRPIRPEDADALKRAFQATSEHDRRMRLFSVMRDLPDEQAARFTQIDYDREICLVAEDPDEPGELLGGARVIADPDNRTAEYAVSVRSAMKGTGLGPRVLAHVIELARKRGIGQVWGTVLRENRAMLAVCERLGFRQERDPDDPEVVKVVKDLSTSGAGAPAAA